MPQNKSAKPLTKMKKPPVDLLFGKSEKQASASNSKIPISKIKKPSSQPRRYFDQEKLKSLAQSIKEHGVLEPLLLRSVDDQYELVAGERRLEASKIANLTEVPAIILDLDDTATTQVRLIENLQREDLNPLEETEGILELLSLHLKIDFDEVAKTLLRMEKGGRGDSSHNVMGSEKIEVIEQVFSSIGKMGWKSFVKNRLPLLNLPPDLLEVLREGKLEYTKVKAISKLKDDEDRKELLREAIANDFSLNQIKDKIKEITKAKDISSSLKGQLSITLRRLKTSKALDDPKKKIKIEKLLSQLDKLLD